MTVIKPALMPHQITGAAFLAQRGFALLLDEPGLGKTATSVHGADLAGAQTILVVCPAVVKQHWAREFARWSSQERQIDVIDGWLDAVPARNVVSVISHDALANAQSVKKLREGAPYDLIIVDEVHIFRHYDAKRTLHLLLPLGPTQSGIWAWAARFWGLTGTPIVNSAADLWPLSYGPMRGELAWWDFCVRYAYLRDGYEGKLPTGIRDPEALADLLRPHVLRRTLDSVGIALPPLEIAPVSLDVDPRALAMVMSDLEAWSPQRLQTALENNDELRDTALARVRKVLGLAKSYAVALHAYHLLRNNQGPVVIFFQHTAVREQLYEMLSQQCGFKVSWIDGKITRAQLALAEEWFQDGRLDVLLVQTQAGGVGLTLHRACRVLVAELPWTAVALWQAVKRCHRIGQTRPVLAEVLRAEGCWLENLLANVVAQKHVASEKLLNLLTAYN